MESKGELNTKRSFSVYCNSIEVSMGRYDFNFVLEKTSPKGNTYLGEITMSPEHAKVFSHILINNIREFESIFGVIPELNEEKIKKLQEEGKIVAKGNINE